MTWDEAVAQSQAQGMSIQGNPDGSYSVVPLQAGDSPMGGGYETQAQQQQSMIDSLQKQLAQNLDPKTGQLGQQAGAVTQGYLTQALQQQAQQPLQQRGAGQGGGAPPDYSSGDPLGQGTGGGGDPAGGGPPSKTAVLLNGPDGTQQQVRDVGQIDSLIQQGWKPVTADGKPMEVKPFGGGTLLNGLPINYYTDGTLRSDQVQALYADNPNLFKDHPGLIDTGLTDKSVSIQSLLGLTSAGTPTGQPGTPGAGGQPSGGSPSAGSPTAPSGTGIIGSQFGPNQNPIQFGTPATNPSGDSPYNLKDWSSLMSALMNNAQNQGQAAQGNLAGVAGLYGQNLNTNQYLANQLYQSQQNQAGATQNQQQGAITAGLANMGVANGLDPSTMAALNAQALEGPQAAYLNSQNALKTKLLESGGGGGGTEPGSASAIASGYGPLLGQLTGQQEQLQQQAELANQQYKQSNLALNNQTALGSLGASTNLQGALNQAYNPAGYMQSVDQSLSGLGTSAYQGGLLGNQAAGNLGGLAQTQGGLQPGSFQNTLYSALLGSLTSPGGNGSGGSILGSIFKGIFGGG